MEQVPESLTGDETRGLSPIPARALGVGTAALGTQVQRLKWKVDTGTPTVVDTIVQDGRGVGTGKAQTW